MARRRRRNRKARRHNASRRHSTHTLKLARAAVGRATRKHRRRNVGRRFGGLTGRKIGRFHPVMNPGMARYRGMMRNRGLLGKLGLRSWRRNSDDVALASHMTGKPIEKAKDLGLMALRSGIGFSTSMVAGHLAQGFMASEYSPLLGNLATVLVSEVVAAKVPKFRELAGFSFTGGAVLAAYVSGMSLLVSKGIVPASIAPYLAPWAEAPLAVAPAVLPAATGAYVAQRGLYGMGSSPIESAMQHRLKMIESGMSGGIFDSKTTLGEYDILESAPTGTNVQSALAAYEVYPPQMGSVDVRAATAGLGAQVEEAFAGLRGLKEYVSVPLNDYVPTGGNVAYQHETAEGKSIYGEIREAARRITQKQLASGKPVDAKFRADLVKAAQQVAGNGEKDVSMAAPAAPLTVEGVPFPGSAIMPVGGIGGQPVSIGDDLEDDGGIFS